MLWNIMYYPNYFLFQRRTARIIADSILNLHKQGLISCNYSESGWCTVCGFLLQNVAPPKTIDHTSRVGH